MYISLFQGMTFTYHSGTLLFSVLIYLMCALLAILVLLLRRKMKIFGNAELGGPTGPKWASGILIFMLWVIYVLLSSLQSYDFIPGI